MKNPFLPLFLILSFSALSPLSALSQQNKTTSNAALAEKIYLQLDGKVYTTDQTIWFKSTVANAFNHASTQLSRILYVELIGPDQKVVEKKLIKLNNGIGDGFFELKKNYRVGVYQIRAYTEWNNNFGQDFIFKEYIRVYAPSDKAEVDPITNFTLLEKPDKTRHLSALIDPLLVDSLHKNNLTLFITHGNKTDSLTLKRGADNKYQLDYDVPGDDPFVKLDVRTKNQLTFNKTVILDNDYLDLQFFPESGELVQGLPAKIGFKALDCRGKGKVVEGEIVDGQGEVVTTFTSNPFGMGSFILSKLDSSNQFTARVKSPSAKVQSMRYALPKISKYGNILSLFKIEAEVDGVKESQIGVVAMSNYQKSDSVYLQVSCRGLLYLDLKGSLDRGKMMFTLSSKSLPDGVIAFTMLDKDKHPIAERLYFNEKPEGRLNVSVQTDTTSYTQRDQTKLEIKTTDQNGQPVSSNLSLLVMNKSQMGEIQDLRQNILSYFLLSSDLKGEIESPGLYFNKGEDHFLDLDVLLLTQGWRKYLYTKPAGDLLTFRPEGGLTVSGSVLGLGFREKKKNTALTMMTMGANPFFQVQTSDKEGRFTFNIGDDYSNKVGVVIQTTNKSGRMKDYIVELEKKDSPAISFNPDLSIREMDSLAKPLVLKNMERKKIDDKYQLSVGDILLKEVVVEGYRMTPERKMVMEEYGKPDLVIDGKDLRKEERKWRWELYDVLKSSFPKMIHIERRERVDDESLMNRRILQREISQLRKFEAETILENHYKDKMITTYLFAQVYNDSTLTIVDGIPVMPSEYPLVSRIPVSEVTSFEIVQNANNFTKLWMNVYASDSPGYKVSVLPDGGYQFENIGPSRGSVIAIYTRGAKGLSGTHVSVGIAKDSVPVFSEPREFYAPKYEKLQPNDWIKPDMRALVHWSPRLTTDIQGKTSTSFYNADNIGAMKVVVEAITEKGEIGYKEIEYEVKARAKPNK